MLTDQESIGTGADRKLPKDVSCIPAWSKSRILTFSNLYLSVEMTYSQKQAVASDLETCPTWPTRTHRNLKITWKLKITWWEAVRLTTWYILQHQSWSLSTLTLYCTTLRRSQWHVMALHTRIWLGVAFKWVLSAVVLGATQKWHSQQPSCPQRQNRHGCHYGSHSGTMQMHIIQKCWCSSCSCRLLRLKGNCFTSLMVFTFISSLKPAMDELEQFPYQLWALPGITRILAEYKTRLEYRCLTLHLNSLSHTLMLEIFCLHLRFPVAMQHRSIGWLWK